MLIFDPDSHSLVTARLFYASRILKIPFVPRTYTAEVTFDTGAAGAGIETDLEERVPTDTWIRSVEYLIRQPNQYAGNLFKPFYDYYKGKSTFFEVTAETVGGPPSECMKVTADGPVPLESFAAFAGDACSNPRTVFGDYFVLGQDMNLRLRVTSVLALTGNAVPCTVKFVIKTLQLDGCRLKSIDANKALEAFEAFRQGAEAR